MNLKNQKNTLRITMQRKFLKKLKKGKILILLFSQCLKKINEDEDEMRFK